MESSRSRHLNIGEYGQLNGAICKVPQISSCFTSDNDRSAVELRPISYRFRANVARYSDGAVSQCLLRDRSTRHKYFEYKQGAKCDMCFVRLGSCWYGVAVLKSSGLVCSRTAAFTSTPIFIVGRALLRHLGDYVAPFNADLPSNNQAADSQFHYVTIVAPEIGQG